MLFWTDNGWKQGDDSLATKQHPRPIKVGSFELLDGIPAQLADRTRFPNLKQIIIGGHNAKDMFHSVCGLLYLFDYHPEQGGCSAP